MWAKTREQTMNTQVDIKGIILQKPSAELFGGYEDRVGALDACE